MRKYAGLLVAILLIMTGAGVTYAVLRMEKSIPAYGIVTLGDAYYYLSGDGVAPLLTLPFQLNASGTYDAQFYIVNKGKTMSGAIAWDTPSWANAAPTDLTITWDLATTIPPNSARLVHVNMRVNRALSPSGTIVQFQYRLIVVGNVAQVTG